MYELLTRSALVVRLVISRSDLLSVAATLPLNCNVIEFPAGIVGDEAAYADETLMDAARRELVEETGYEAASLHEVFTGASSAGMSDELSTFFIALGLKKISGGGGVEHEKITIHEVPLIDVECWLTQQELAGAKLDARIYSGLYLLERFRGTVK